MFIKSLELEDFKQFRQLKIRFPGDITVIKGPNEKGKSSIVEAIIAALFYDPKKSNEAIRSLKSWGNERLYKISMNFESEGENFTLEKDFEKRASALKNDETGDVIDNGKDIGKKLAQAGGYQNAELFLNTSCVRQGELSFLDRKKTITEALQDVISGGGISVSLNSILRRIAKAREEARRGLDRGLAKNPGTILRIKNSIQEQTKLLEEKRKMFEERGKLSESLAGLEGKHRNLSDKLEVKGRVRKKVLANFESLEELKRLNNEYENIQKILESAKGLEEELSEVSIAIKPLEKFAELNIKELVKTQSEINSLSTQMKKLEGQIDELKSGGAGFKKTLNPKYAVVVAAFGALGLLGFVFGHIFYSFFLLMLAVLAWAFVSNSFFFRTNVKNLHKELQDIKKDYASKSSELKEALSSLGVETPDIAEESKEKLQSLKNRAIVVESKIEGIFGDRSKESLKTRQREIEKRIAVEESKMEPGTAFKMPTSEQFEKFEKDMEVLSKQIASLDKEISSLQARISHLNISNEEINGIEEKLFSFSEELKIIERRTRILEILENTLTRAQQNAFSATKSTIEEYIAKFISTITADKYKDVSISPDMGIKVFSSEKGEYVVPEGNLSRGAIEQVYLVARFALIYVLFPREKTLPRPLVVLDDAFGNFDSERKSRTKNIIKELSHKFQIVILTCSDDYDTWGKVIDLEKI